MNKVMPVEAAVRLSQSSLAYEVKPIRKPTPDMAPISGIKPTMSIQGIVPHSVSVQTKNLSLGQRIVDWIKVDPQPADQRGAVARFNREVQQRLLASTVPVDDGFGSQKHMTVRALRALYLERTGVDITQQSVFGWGQAFERQWAINQSGNMPRALNAPLAASATLKNRIADPLLDEVMGKQSSFKHTRYDTHYIWTQVQRNKANIVQQLRRERAQK